MTRTKLRLGIDVGGTFTDVVAIDATTLQLVAQVKTPTTHDAADGVAAGIVTGVERLLGASGVAPEDVAFIAHSTTQATNALLEGDLARVGVLGLLRSAAWLARRQMHFQPVPLGAGSAFAPDFAFVREGDDAAIRASLDRFLERGVRAVAASAPFGVDRPLTEAQAVARARERGLEATCGHDVSAAYGLRARTRTAALNAAVLPRMVKTSRLTAAAVQRAAIPAPLMVMRSDGGVMDVKEIERRPILTLLSGPAAGIAGALLYERLTDGIFVEVGGTSSDCSVIRAGRPQMRPARIGGHRTMLRTLDVRTLGIAGGSMIRLAGERIGDVGPRSAHIAGCSYACFSEPAALAGATVETIAPAHGDASDYAVLIARDGRRIAPTVTCAANVLGSIPHGAFARGDRAAARQAFSLLAQHLGGNAESVAEAVVERAVRKLRAALEELADDYGLDVATLTLLGGGGAAGAILPQTAAAMGVRWRIARDAEVIAPIGVALALVRDVVERTIVSPTPRDVARIRREAADRAVAAGASPDRVEVTVEIDAQRNRVRATASGAAALVDAAVGRACDEDERRDAAAGALSCRANTLQRHDLTGRIAWYASDRSACAVDERGIVQLVLHGAGVSHATVRDAAERVRSAIEAATRYGDVGRALPALYVVRGARIAAFEGLTDTEQAAALVLEEIDGADSGEPLAFVTVPRPA